MANPVKLKPAVVDGITLRIAKPQGGYLADAGEPVVLTSYWRRRLKCGDVECVPAAVKARADKTTE